MFNFKYHKRNLREKFFAKLFYSNPIKKEIKGLETGAIILKEIHMLKQLDNLLKTQNQPLRKNQTSDAN